MRSTREVVRTAGISTSAISLRPILEERKIDSLMALAASVDIEQVYRKKGGPFGFGPPAGGAFPVRDGTYQQNYQVGFATHAMSGPIQFVSSYAASVEIAAIKCFGTEDPSGEDEPYLIISVISVNPNFAGEDELVTTKIVRADNIHAGDMFAVGQTIGSAKIVAGDGLRVHMALFEHEHGSPEDVRKQIEDTIREAVKKAAQTLTTLADVPLAGSLGEVASNPIVIALTEGLSALITPLLADDQIGGEKVLPLKASQLVDLALDETKPESVQAFQKSLMTTPEIGPDIEFNFPADHEDRRWLFEGGGGSYKVYLKVIPTRNAFPVP